MSEILRSKRLAALTAVVALGSIAAGCGSSKSKTSTESAKPAGTTTEHVVGNPATTTTATSPQEASTGHINSMKNLCNTGVSAMVKSIVGNPNLTCSFAGADNVGQNYWGIDPNTHLPKASIIVATYPPSVAQQIPGYSQVMKGGDATDASIDGVQCTWEANVPNYRCYDGNTIIGGGIFSPSASLDATRQLMHLVLQTVTQ